MGTGDRIIAGLKEALAYAKGGRAPEQQKLLTTAEAAKFLGRSPSTLRAWRHREMGPPYMQPIPGTTAVYREADLHEFKQRDLLKKED